MLLLSKTINTIEQGRKRPLDTPKRMIERREREGKRERKREREREREKERERKRWRERERESERERKGERERERAKDIVSQRALASPKVNRLISRDLQIFKNFLILYFGSIYWSNSQKRNLGENVYFTLRFCLVYSINTYLRCCIRRNF